MNDYLLGKERGEERRGGRGGRQAGWKEGKRKGRRTNIPNTKSSIQIKESITRTVKSSEGGLCRPPQFMAVPVV